MMRMVRTDSMIPASRATLTGDGRLESADTVDELIERLHSEQFYVHDHDNVVEIPIADFMALCEPCGPVLGSGTSGTASPFTFTPPHGASKKVVIKAPTSISDLTNKEWVPYYEHEARIAHRLKDGVVWSSKFDPWVPLTTNGVVFRAIEKEFYALRHRSPGADNIHHLITMAHGINGVNPYLVSEFAEGDLGRAVRQGGFSHDLAKWSAVARGICNGIAYMHSLDVSHNDLKPANILYVYRGNQIHPLIADFGNSTVVDPLTGYPNVAQAMFVGCTPNYQAPELARVPLTDQRAGLGQVDLRTADLYSVAVTLCGLAADWLYGIGGDIHSHILNSADRIALDAANVPLRMTMCKVAAGCPYKLKLNRPMHHMLDDPLVCLAADVVLAGDDVAGRVALYEDLLRGLSPSSPPTEPRKRLASVSPARTRSNRVNVGP